MSQRVCCHTSKNAVHGMCSNDILIIAVSLLCYGNALPSRPYWDHTAKPPVKSTPNVICDACAEHDYNCLIICKENAVKIKSQDQSNQSITNALLLDEAVVDDDDGVGAVVVVVGGAVVNSCKLEEFNKYEEAVAKADVSTAR
ncbi:hypothetical protein T11_2204 [Trichinella zimbabwensis]|uniref:Uncharacterized protein n=1 Tax=Trichinella zimbabwensis TaxID=268475 RepID=A0A0V1HQG1_9BILA|nr:hypothetical protein T11_2204 [Trichinella zimbabwensis]